MVESRKYLIYVNSNFGIGWLGSVNYESKKIDIVSNSKDAKVYGSTREVWSEIDTMFKLTNYGGVVRALFSYVEV